MAQPVIQVCQPRLHNETLLQHPLPIPKTKQTPDGLSVCGLQVKVWEFVPCRLFSFAKEV